MTFSASAAYLIAGEHDARSVAFALINADPVLLHHLALVLAACELAEVTAEHPPVQHADDAEEEAVSRCFDLLEGGLRSLVDGHFEAAAAAQARLFDLARPLLTPSGFLGEEQFFNAGTRRLCGCLLSREVLSPLPAPPEARGVDRITSQRLETSLFWMAAAASLVIVLVLRRYDGTAEYVRGARTALADWADAFLDEDGI